MTQTQCRVCAVTLEDVERALAGSISSRPQPIALEPNALDDIWKGIRQVASACGIASKADEVASTLRHRMARISTRAFEDTHRPRVACIEWHEPLMAAGNWVPELMELANAENLFGKPGCILPG